MNKQQFDLVIETAKLNVECFILLNGDNILFGFEGFTPVMEKTCLGIYEQEVLRITRKAA